MPLTTIQKSQATLIILQIMSILLVLLGYHVITFCLWYAEIKTASMYDMNTNYAQYLSEEDLSNEEAFKKYILAKNTVVISPEDTLTCSPGILDAIHADDERMREIISGWWYKDEEKLYFLFRTTYPDIGEVRIFYDATKQWQSLIIHLQITLAYILIFGGIQAWVGWRIFERIFRPLRDIQTSLERRDLDTPSDDILLALPPHDEIRVIFEQIQDSIHRLGEQAHEHKQFVSNLSHELKTPLMAIGSRLDLIEKKQESSKREDTHFIAPEIKYLQKHLESINEIIESLTLLAQIQSDRYQRQDTLIALEGVVESIAEMYPHREIQIHGRAIRSVDTRLFRIIMRNLIGNAIKYSESDDPVVIRVESDSLSVVDTGIGMDSTTQSRIFEEHYQASHDRGGLGLGLSLSCKIAQIEGWRLTCQSEPTKGTTMTLYF